jgi:lysophospholipase L1-like esterase
MNMKLSLLLAGLAAAQKIMYLGDSITEITCWRAKVADQLATSGLSGFSMVGSMTNNPQNCQSSNPSWDKHHEGHSGYLAINIANTNLQGWLANTKPDIVQFMLGTNDVFQGRSQTDILAAYTKIVQLIRAANPAAKIIVDTVIPLPMNNQPIINLNTAIPNWASGLNSTASPIHLADVYNAPYPPSALRDGVHPNDAGDAIIARIVGPLLINLIREFQATNAQKVAVPFAA